LLRRFLYEAIFQPQGAPPLPADIVDEPALSAYIENFGRPGDHCLIAEVEGSVVGAVWTRPELAVSLLKRYRHMGIGTALIRRMLRLLRRLGYPQVSLSVQKANEACRLYRRLGFQVFSETAADYVMVYPLREE